MRLNERFLEALLLFDRSVKTEKNSFEQVLIKLDACIKNIYRLETLLQKASHADKKPETSAIKTSRHNVRLFRFAIENYQKEMEEDPASDNTLQMEMIALDAQARSSKNFSAFMAHKFTEISSHHKAINDTFNSSLKFSLVPIVLEGEEVLLEAVVDISEQKRTQQQLDQAREKAESASLAKSEFLANMSHEIRTPMNAIINMCELVLTETDISRKQYEYLNIVRSSSRSLLGIINDILDFSKIEAGKLEMEKTPLSLRELLEDISDMFRDRIQEKQLECIVDVSPAVPRTVMTDPLRLRQVLVNLLTNALKFTETGEICLSVENKANADNETELLFSIRDTGVGIDPAVQEKLFDAFAQADGSTTRKYGGTGLGLAICKRIVLMMGGQIWVESRPGAGSTFLFTAKFQYLTDEVVRPCIAPPALKNLKVLIVEDNATTARIIRHFVESFGFRAEMASTADQALTLYVDNRDTVPFDLILMDILLPDMDGIAVAEKIKKDYPGTAPPIVIVSARGRGKTHQRARQAGFDSYLTKPVSPSRLFNTIMDIFGCEAGRPTPKRNEFANSTPFSDACILLVEDNETNKMVATEILKSTGVDIEVAINGLEAVEAVQKKRFDAVLMDIQMPEMDGMEATRAIRDRLQMQDLLIIAMTAHAMSGDRDKCLAAGMNGYVSKPIDQQELFATLRDHIRPSKGLAQRSLKSSGVGSTYEDTAQPPLPGLDVAEGVRRVGGRRDRYFAILQKFCRNQENFPSEFRRLVQNGKYEAAGGKAHALKGAAGNLSAVDLMEAARVLEQAGSHDDRSQLFKSLTAVEQTLRPIIAAVEKIDQTTTASDQETSSNDQDEHTVISDLLSRLHQSLGKLDPAKSESCLAELRSNINTVEYKSEIEKLEAQILAYDFEGAQKALKPLTEKLDIKAKF